MSIEVAEPTERPLVEKIRLAALAFAKDSKMDALAATTIVLARLTLEADVNPAQVVESYCEALGAFIERGQPS